MINETASNKTNKTSKKEICCGSGSTGTLNKNKPGKQEKQLSKIIYFVEWNRSLEYHSFKNNDYKFKTEVHDHAHRDECPAHAYYPALPRRLNLDPYAYPA